MKDLGLSPQRWNVIYATYLQCRQCSATSNGAKTLHIESYQKNIEKFLYDSSYTNIYRKMIVLCIIPSTLLGSDLCKGTRTRDPLYCVQTQHWSLSAEYSSAQEFNWTDWTSVAKLCYGPRWFSTSKPSTVSFSNVLINSLASYQRRFPYLLFFFFFFPSNQHRARFFTAFNYSSLLLPLRTRA